MKSEERRDILNLLDLERQTIASPGMVRVSDGEVIREVAEDGKSCWINYSRSSVRKLDRIIQDQMERAQLARYELEWKLYGHDEPPCLGERLTAAGFVTGPQEAFMILPANEEALNRFRGETVDIRRITDANGLEDVRKIAEEVYGRSYQRRMEQSAMIMEKYPRQMSVYVAYVDGEPAATGRVYFQEGSRFAGLYEGQTRERFRKRGLFTQLVAIRVREAVSRGMEYVCVDALPTSEPILRKLGFEGVTYTQPFCFSG